MKFLNLVKFMLFSFSMQLQMGDCKTRYKVNSTFKQKL